MLDDIKNAFLHIKSDIELVFVKIMVPEGKNRVLKQC